MAAPDREFVLVTEYFHPETASTGQLLTDLAVGLRERGLDLTVLTGQPNYHSGENERQPRVTTHEGVPVRRVRAPQVRQSSLPRRLVNWIVFTAWTSLALLASRTDRPRELVFVSNPPFLPVAMWLVCRLRGWEYTFVVYDIYPDHAVRLGHIRDEGFVARLWDRLVVRVLRSATTVVALGPVMKDRLVEKAGDGFDPEKVEVIHNWADTRFIEPLAKADNPFCEEHGLVEPFVVLYSGNLGRFHDLETVVRAAAAFEDDPVVFLVIGEGDAKSDVVALAEELGVAGETVRFLPYQPYEDLPVSLTAGDVSLVTVRDGFEGLCVSSKLYTQLAAGTPILCVARAASDEARIVRQHDVGVQVDPGDHEAVADAVREWMASPEAVSEQGQRARQLAESEFSRERAIDEYYQVLA